MRPLLGLAWRSAWNRRGTLSLVVASIALATLLLLSFERMRADVRESFSQAVSGTDLIVGARTGPVQLMLYAVFRVGGATNNIRVSSEPASACIEPLRCVARSRRRPEKRQGSNTLSSTLRYGNKLNCWKM